MKKLDLKNLIKFVILVAIIVWIAIPTLIPFVGSGIREEIRSTVRQAFGGGGGFGVLGLSLPRLFTLAAVLAFTAAAYLALSFILERIRFRSNRSRTISGLALNVCKYAALLVGIIWGLSVLGVNTTAMLASVGIVGLIVGFGAQSLIADIITGIFIIFEGQFNVGDIIVLDDFRGIVIRIGVRTTVIQDSSGSMKIVNNSDIRSLQNRSMDLSVAICEMAISHDQDLPMVESLLHESLPRIKDSFPDIIPEVPEYVGIQRFEGASVILRVVAKVQETNIYAAQRILNRELKLLFTENGVRTPFTITPPDNRPSSKVIESKIK